VSRVEGRREDQVRGRKPQLLEIGRATQAEIERLFRKRYAGAFDAETYEFGAGDGCVADRPGGFEHGPVDRRQTQTGGA